MTAESFTTVEVGPFTYQVLLDEAAIDKQAHTDGSSFLMGHTNPPQQEILIRPGLGADQQADVLLHEVLHACFDLIGGLNSEDDTEETIVRRLSPALLDVLRSNRHLLDLLT